MMRTQWLMLKKTVKEQSCYVQQLFQEFLERMIIFFFPVYQRQSSNCGYEAV